MSDEAVDGLPSNAHYLLPDEEGTVTLTLHVNGRPRTVRARPAQPLVEVLRDELRLGGARAGCGVGMCGACTVLKADVAVNSCLLPTGLVGESAITTVEGLADPDGELSTVQSAFVRHRAFQCSYCTSGFVMALEGLLLRVPTPDEQDIEEALSGHICRCGSYSRIMAAARELLGGVESRHETSAREASGECEG